MQLGEVVQVLVAARAEVEDDLAPPARLTAPQRDALAKLLAPVAGLLPEARGLADLPAGRFPLSLTPSFIGAKIYSQEARPVLLNG